MTQDVRQYFKGRSADSPWLAERTGTQLARSGIDDMALLCELLESQPEKLLDIRNIGPKSMLVIQMVCAAYRKERGDAG